VQATDGASTTESASAAATSDNTRTSADQAGSSGPANPASANATTPESAGSPLVDVRLPLLSALVDALVTHPPAGLPGLLFGGTAPERLLAMFAHPEWVAVALRKARVFVCFVLLSFEKTPTYFTFFF
jgi:hypothetical protein